jgi:serine/threonine protein phosphatase PrpC
VERIADVDDARLYFARDLAAPECFEIAQGTAVVFTARPTDRKGTNEDSAALIPFAQGAALLVVADGVGGAPAGEQASRVAIEAIWSRLAEAGRSTESTPGLVLESIEAARDAVRAIGLGAATTLVALEIAGESLRTYHVGDSRAIVASRSGRLKLQTVSHSPVGFAVEAGVLDERRALHHAQRHLVSNVLGAADARIEVGSPLRIARFDTALIGSDGLFDNLYLEEIAEGICSGPLEGRVSALIAQVRERMEQPVGSAPSKPDDLTLIAFRRRVAVQKGNGEGQARRRVRSSP